MYGIAVDAVLSNSDLVTLILRGRMSPYMYFAASLVWNTWYEVCRTDEALLRLVALYQGSLTRSAFARLFALPYRQVVQIPHSTHIRMNGGIYHLYDKNAVDTVLAPPFGFKQWRDRLADPQRRRLVSQPCDWRLEEKIHQYHTAPQKRKRDYNIFTNNYSYLLVNTTRSRRTPHVY